MEGNNENDEEGEESREVRRAPVRGSKRVLKRLCLIWRRCCGLMTSMGQQQGPWALGGSGNRVVDGGGSDRRGYWGELGLLVVDGDELYMEKMDGERQIYCCCGKKEKNFGLVFFFNSLFSSQFLSPSSVLIPFFSLFFSSVDFFFLRGFFFFDLFFLFFLFSFWFFSNLK